MKKQLLLSAFFICSLFLGVAQAQTKAKTKKVVAPDSTAIMQSFAGTYDFSSHTDFQSVEVKVENGKLLGKSNTQTDYTTLVPTSIPDKFTSNSAEVAAEVTFTRNANKKVTGVRVYYNGVDVSGKKTP